MKGGVRTAIGILLSILLLWWALRDVSAVEVISRIRSADPLLLTLSILIALGVFWVRAFRWGILLQPVAGPVPLRPRVGAVFIGFALNNMLPARIGEVARAFSLSRVTQVPVAASFATLVVERLLDGIVLAGLMFGAMATSSIPGVIDGRTRSMAFAVAAFMGAVVIVLGAAVASPSRAGKVARLLTRPLPARMGDGVIRVLRSFGLGLNVLKTPGLFFASAGLTIFQWCFAALSYLFAFRAFHIDQVPYGGAVFLQSLMSFAVAPPSTPGFFGPFEAAAKLGLRLWGVPDEQSVSFAIGYHIAGFIPVNLIGLYYIWSLGLSWKGVRQGGDGSAGDGIDEWGNVTPGGGR